VAVIAATHRNLREMIERQQFREDLYYRLNGLVVRLPALRERSDRVAIAHKILRAECPGCTPALDDDVLQLVTRYHWPGNIRQLASVLRTAAVMAGDEARITRAHLSDDFLEDASGRASTAVPAAVAVASPVVVDRSAPPEPPSATLQALELDAIRRVVEETGGNISVASRRLGISRNTIYRKLRWRC
jgi:transcriptional regulator of acetoin/glycerol metabolism